MTDLELTESLLKASELFPDVPIHHISHVLQVSNDNLDTAIEQLLNYDLIKENIANSADPDLSEKGNIGHREYIFPKDVGESSAERGDQSSYETAKGFKKENSEGGTKKTINNELELIKLEQIIERIEMQDYVMDLLGIEESNRDLVDWFLEQNKFDKLNSICDIMLNLNPELPPNRQSRLSFAKTSLNDIVPRNLLAKGSTSMSDLIKGDQQNAPISQFNLYWDEIKGFIKSNPELDLPDKFYMLCINWFQNDVAKVIHLAVELNTCFVKCKSKNSRKKRDQKVLDWAQVTYALNTPNHGKSHEIDSTEWNVLKPSLQNLSFRADSPKTLESLEQKARNLKNVRNVTNDKHLKAYYSNSIRDTKHKIRQHKDYVQISEVSSRVERAKTSHCIDFHDLTVQNAMTALEQVLTYWWDLEMHNRNISNTKFELVNVQHVPPFKIVTGRGLHSSGGIPKIKNATIKYLQLHKYKFEENASSIQVTGKRRI